MTIEAVEGLVARWHAGACCGTLAAAAALAATPAHAWHATLATRGQVRLHAVKVPIWNGSECMPLAEQRQAPAHQVVARLQGEGRGGAGEPVARAWEKVGVVAACLASLRFATLHAQRLRRAGETLDGAGALW